MAGDTPWVLTAIPCMGYDDFLRLTLPRALELLPHLTVVTAPGDAATQRLARSLGADVMINPSWRQGGPLNKGAALNAWLDRHSDSDAWRMVLDADVLLWNGVCAEPQGLDTRVLYSAHRRMCVRPEAFRQLLAGRRTLDSFPLETAPSLDGTVWGKVHTWNSAALAGYLQLWRPGTAAGLPRFPETGTAEGYDLVFALSFPEQHRRLLGAAPHPLEVLHLGPVGHNWSGRRSPRWDAVEPESRGALP